ncbi:unnamed protein product, partial [Didymodactylos carnosus]
YVHLTETTYKLLEDNYNVEPGEPYQLHNHTTVATYLIKKRQLDHRITRKPPAMTAATAAAIAVASGVSNIAVPLIESAQANPETIPDDQQNVTSPLLEETNRVRSNTLTDDTLPAPLIDDGFTSNDIQLTTVTVQPEQRVRGATISSVGAGDTASTTPVGFIDQSQLMQTLNIQMSPITLCFTDGKLEKSYGQQSIATKSAEQSQQTVTSRPLFYSNTLFNLCFDSFLSFLILLLGFASVSAGVKLHLFWIIPSIIFLITELVLVCLLFYFFRRNKHLSSPLRYIICTLNFLFPILMVYFLLYIKNQINGIFIIPYLFIAILTVHYTLYSGAISYLYKLGLSILFIVGYAILSITVIEKNTSLNRFYPYELSLHIILAFFLVHLISHHLELKHRQLFYIDHKSSEQHLEMGKERERADWLLRNILPEHVIEPLRLKGGTYSKNHECVGVMFATLTNFHVMYEEQFEGGRFYSRVLNEFYGDIEELFLSKRFERIEKIKTIGSTYMAASGLQ